MSSITHSVCGAVAMFLVLTAPLLQGCSSGDSSVANESTDNSESELKKSAKTITLAELTKIVHDNEIPSDSGGGCSFSSSSHGNALELELTSDEDGTVKLSVSPQQKIVVTSKDESFTYTIAGVGSINILNADDAFNRVTLTTFGAGKKSAACEVDF